MLIKKNSDLAIKSSFFIYLLVFVLAYPVINIFNLLFYVFLVSAWLMFVFLVYLLLYKQSTIDYSRYILIIGFLIGLVLNVTSIFSLSTDIYRYLYDGFLIQHHLNPYIFSPNNYSIRSITRNFPFLANINNPSVSSPYPPLMIFLSFLFVSLFGYNLLVWLLVSNVLVCLTGFFLMKILKMLSINPNRAILWFNPLVFLIFDSSGHNDIIAFFFLVLSIYFLLKAKASSNKMLILSGCFLALAIGIKIFPLLLVPFLIRKLKIGIIFTILLSAIQFLIFLAFINFKNSGIVKFLQYWRGNGGLFEIVYFFINYFNSYKGNNQLGFQIRILFSILFILISCILFVLYYFRPRTIQIDETEYIKIFEFAGVSFISLFILSPIIEPWYVVWAIIPFIITADKKFYPYWIFLVINNFTYIFYLYLPIAYPFMLFEYFTFYFALIIYYCNKPIKNMLKRINPPRLRSVNEEAS